MPSVRIGRTGSGGKGIARGLNTTFKALLPIGIIGTSGRHQGLRRSRIVTRVVAPTAGVAVEMSREAPRRILGYLLPAHTGVPNFCYAPGYLPIAKGTAL